MKIAIIDYGMGNLRSVYKAVQRAGGSPIITSSHDEIIQSDKIILPGVGHFKKGMENLNSLGLLDLLNEEVICNRKHILGICLGMQLMMEYSEEGNVAGMGWFEGKVVRFKVSDTTQFKIPHMGWNDARFTNESILNTNINIEDEFYFVHSYHVEIPNKTDIMAISNYNYDFVSAIAKDNIIGFQFHPEKSHSSGLKLLKKFIL